MDAPALNTPASGSYGEKTALDNLKAALPVGNPAPPAAAPMPPMSSVPIGAPASAPEGRPTGAVQPPPGIPPALVAPTNLPNQPVNTPMSPQASGVPMQAPDEQRLALLELLASSPNVAQATRDWARQVIGFIVGTQHQSQ